MSTGWRLVVAGLIVIVALAALGMVVQNSSLLVLFEDSQQLVTWVRGRGAWAPLAVVVLQIAQVVLAPIPGQAIGVAAGYLFGTLWGTFYCLAGMAAGSWIAFRLARSYGRPFVEQMVSRQTLVQVDAGAKRRGLFFFALVFLLPFLPDDVACFVAGLTTIPIPALMIVALTARAPGILVSAWIGANAQGLSTAQWAVLIAGCTLLAGLALLCGEPLQQWLMIRLAGEGDGANSRPPSHEA